MAHYDQFKTYSNIELLRIIDNPEDYQPDAVESANSILSERQLPEDEIKIAKDELEIERQENLNKNLKKIETEIKLKKIGKSIIDNINPIQKETPTTGKTIKNISLLFSVIYIYQLYKEFGMLKYIFSEGLAGLDSSLLPYVLVLGLILTTAVLFYKKKKLGWLIMIIFLTFSIVSTIKIFIWTLTTKPTGIEGLDKLFPQTSPITLLFTILIFSGLIWAISKENIRAIYSINKKTMFVIMAVTAIITGFVF